MNTGNEPNLFCYGPNSRWRHQMETFSALLAICAGNSPVSGEVPAQRPMTRSFEVFFDLRLNKRLSKTIVSWWFETLSRPLWRHCKVVFSDGKSMCLTVARQPMDIFMVEISVYPHPSIWKWLGETSGLYSLYFYLFLWKQRQPHRYVSFVIELHFEMIRNKK